MGSEECACCVEPFKANLSAPIPCTTCDYVSCLACFERYQQDIKSGLFEVVCMNCKTPWDDDHVHKHVTPSVAARLKKVSKKRMRDQETAFLPQTQLYVEMHNEVLTKKVPMYHNLAREYGELHTEVLTMEIADFDDREETSRNFRELRAKRLTLAATKNQVVRLRDDINAWKRRLVVYGDSLADIVPAGLRRRPGPGDSSGGSASSGSGSSAPTVLGPCPKDDCRGFVTVSAKGKGQCKCGVCGQSVCRKCLCADGDDPDHVCAEADVQTATEIMRSSKPCPNCAVRIHKIDGCHQMWCTHCNTAFCWVTGKILRNDAIHNPHYYQWLRENPNAVGPGGGGGGGGACDGLPDSYRLHRHLHIGVFPGFGRQVKFIMNVHQICSHTLYDTLNNRNDPALTLADTRVPRFDTNLDIRFKWMQNKMTDEAFETTLVRRHKAQIVKHRTFQVYDLLVTLCSDVFHRVLRNADRRESVMMAFRKEFEEIFAYANACFAKLADVYRVKMPTVKLPK